MELQDELMRLWERECKTVLMVTHDVGEALLLADQPELKACAVRMRKVLEMPAGDH